MQILGIRSLNTERLSDHILGHIPTDKDVDTSIKAIGYCFTILSIGNKTIGKVKVERDNNVAV